MSTVMELFIFITGQWFEENHAFVICLFIQKMPIIHKK